MLEGRDLFGVRDLGFAAGIFNQACLIQFIMPGFSKGGQYFMSNQTLEGFGLWLAAAEDEAIQASLIETPHLLPTTKDRYWILTSFVIIQTFNRLIHIGIAQHITWPFRGPPGLPVVIQKELHVFAFKA